MIQYAKRLATTKHDNSNFGPWDPGETWSPDSLSVATTCAQTYKYT